MLPSIQERMTNVDAATMTMSASATHAASARERRPAKDGRRVTGAPA